jgi:hypothetical protein
MALPSGEDKDVCRANKEKERGNKVVMSFAIL